MKGKEVKPPEGRYDLYGDVVECDMCKRQGNKFSLVEDEEEIYSVYAWYTRKGMWFCPWCVESRWQEIVDKIVGVDHGKTD